MDPNTLFRIYVIIITSIFIPFYYIARRKDNNHNNHNHNAILPINHIQVQQNHSIDKKQQPVPQQQQQQSGDEESLSTKSLQDNIKNTKRNIKHKKSYNQNTILNMIKEVKEQYEQTNSIKKQLQPQLIGDISISGFQTKRSSNNNSHIKLKRTSSKKNSIISFQDGQTVITYKLPPQRRKHKKHNSLTVIDSNHPQPPQNQVDNQQINQQQLIIQQQQTINQEQQLINQQQSQQIKKYTWSRIKYYVIGLRIFCKESSNISRSYILLILLVRLLFVSFLITQLIGWKLAIIPIATIIQRKIDQQIKKNFKQSQKQESIKILIILFYIIQTVIWLTLIFINKCPANVNILAMISIHLFDVFIYDTIVHLLYMIFLSEDFIQN